MLVAIVLILESKAKRTAYLPPYLGVANSTQLMAYLRETQPGADRILHNAAGLKPITCSNLMGTEILGWQKVAIQPRSQYWVRFTGLTTAASTLLLETLCQPKLHHWVLDGHHFEVVGAICDSAQHEWSGRSSYEALFGRSALKFNLKRRLPALQGASSETISGKGIDGKGIEKKPEKVIDKVTIELETPTAFKSRKQQMILPTPDLFFGSLCDRWNKFCAVKLDDQTRNMAHEQIAIGEFDLNSRLVRRTQGGAYSGAVGHISYVGRFQSQSHRDLFYTLSDYAFYSGVGSQTASGMGQVRRVNTG